MKGISGGVNLYGFVRNGPINAFDPWGLLVFSGSFSKDTANRYQIVFVPKDIAAQILGEDYVSSLSDDYNMFQVDTDLVKDRGLASVLEHLAKLVADRISLQAAVDDASGWTFGVGGTGSYGFFVGGGISVGFYFGHSQNNGWSYGVLETTFLGEGGPPNIFGGFFVQATNAGSVGQLKGLGGVAGGGGGEVYGGGIDAVLGSGYKGVDVQGWWTFGAPWEAHAGGTFTSGWDSDKGWGW